MPEPTIFYGANRATAESFAQAPLGNFFQSIVLLRETTERIDQERDGAEFRETLAAGNRERFAVEKKAAERKNEIRVILNYTGLNNLRQRISTLTRQGSTAADMFELAYLLSKENLMSNPLFRHIIV